MLSSALRWLLPAACLFAVVTTSAQGPAHSAPADPLDPQAQVPQTVHSTSLSHYRRWRDETLLPWREANDRVARIGGWRAYAREAARADAPASAASAPGAGAKP
jgi:hypothetical protein